jgi:flagellar hook-associated protein 2
MAISSPGIGSNLDVNGIVSQLMQIEQRPLTLLNTKEADYQAKLTAYGSIKGALSSFQTSVRGLSDVSKFTALKSTSSDATIASASASSVASDGNYSVNVSKLAQPQKLIAAGQSTTTTAIGSGVSTTLTFDLGTVSGGSFTAYDSVTGIGGTYTGSTFASNGAGIKTITIDSTNNSLAGIRDAINSAGLGIKASIINDGGASPYRLVLSSDNAGSASSIKIGVSGEAAISNFLAHDPAGTQSLQETVTAQNTEMTVDGVFVSKAGTVVSDVIPGVTLSALKTGSTTINVSRDTASVKSAVESFVKAYNDVSKTLKDSSAYNASTKESAILQGDSTVRSISNKLRSILNQPLPGGSALNTLSQVGVSFQKDGTLALDSAKLQSAIDNNYNDIAGVFAAAGKATDSLVSYTGSTSATKAGNYSLSISQLATRGAVEGSAAAGLTISAGVNDALNVTVDGVSTSLTLAAGTYTAATLTAEVQSRINGASGFSSAGISVAVTESSGVLAITSSRYGSASNVAITGIGAAGLLGASPSETGGLDVAGSINGVAATGSGQYLTAVGGNDAEGLKLLITGGGTGSRGSVSFSQGYAYQLDQYLGNLLDSEGQLAGRTDGINRSIEDIAGRREVLGRRLAAIELRYRNQFTSLDTLISSMTQTSNFLAQQLANLPGAN